MRAFKTYVRPILEYACEVVNPYLAHDVETLERVQRDYARRIAHSWHRVPGLPRQTAQSGGALAAE